MNVVPVVFAFDNNIVMPACVCITSLLENAHAETFYDIYILHANDVSLDKTHLGRIATKYSNCSITYRVVDDTFKKAFEIRHVTIATYYRLLLSQLLPQYDKVIYSDVDIIFRMDLSDLYQQNMSEYYIAATLDLGLNYLDPSYVRKHNDLEIGKYVQAGFVVFNLKKIREDNVTSNFVEHALKHKYIYQDQDILNICCRGKIKYLPPCYNVNDCSFLALREYKMLGGIYSPEQCNYARCCGNIHYSGKKPWKENCIFMDVWWEYYRRSVVYDVDNHFDFFFRLSFYLDTLSLRTRLKNLLKYFVYGKSKG